MQFNKNTSLGKFSIQGLVVKSILAIIVAVSVFFLLNKIDFPAPKKGIEKIIPNENFQIVK